MHNWKTKIMLHCLELAKKGKSSVGSNPMVGAVLVSKEKKILCEGYHKGFGQKHAEVDALEKIAMAPEGSCLFVNLEPCCHQGINPPCIKIIIEKKIKKVMIGTLDPNPKVNGGGILELQKNSIAVETGICQEECEELNQKYLAYRRQKKIFVALKIAASLDGKIALKNEISQWITGNQAREKSHQLRSEFAAIAVGKKTLINDNPQLNNRISKTMPQPSPVVFWGNEELPKNCFFLQDTRKKFLIAGKNISPSYLKKIAQKNLFVFLSSMTRPSLQEALNFLHQQKIFSLLVEGGNSLLTSFLQTDLVNKIYLFLAPKILGEDAKNWCGALDLLQLPKNQWNIKKITPLEEDILLEINPQNPYINQKNLLKNND